MQLEERNKCYLEMQEMRTALNLRELLWQQQFFSNIELRPIPREKKNFNTCQKKLSFWLE